MTELPAESASDLARLAFDLSPAGMLAVGPEGHVLLANREVERMFGFAPGELRGIRVDHLVPRDRRDTHAFSRHTYFAAPEARSMGAGRELFGLRRDGTEFPVEVGLNPVKLGNTVVVVASVVDITERRRAERAQRETEERTRQAQKLESLGTLAGGIAHDFNNILLGIVGYAELAQRAATGQPRVTDDLDQVLRAAERGRQLVRRLLMFTRDAEVEKVPLAMDRVVREATELLRASLPSTIAIRLDVEPGLPRVLADETMVHQILLNLGTNAAHAMEDGGLLRIALSAANLDANDVATRPELTPGRYIRLEVDDNGVGMTPEVRARVFEPFFTTKAPGKATGLGMAVIMGIVRSLSGAIDLESEVGVGTRVLIWLPCDRTAATVPEPSQGSPGEPNFNPALHVLFVEDEPALASMERRQLEALGYRVTVYTSSLEALIAFQADPGRYDLLLTDNTMPGMTGLQLAKQLTQMRPELPVLMVSGYAERSNPEELESHGVGAVLRKPHSAAELNAALRALLSRR